MKQIAAVILALITTWSFAQNANPYPKTITVTGSAEIELIPDEIYVMVTLKGYEKKGSGKTDLEKIKTEFLDNCHSIGLPDSVISIASYEGMISNYWRRKRKNGDELNASIAYQIKFTNTKKIDELVNKLDDDATQNFQVVMLSHSKIQEYRKQMKIQAIKAAREKAAYMAEAIGEKAGEAVTISELVERTSIPYNSYSNTSHMMINYSKNEDSESETAIDFKKIKIKMEVNAVFALK